MYKIYFAPLQGYTEDAYRRLHNKYFGGVEAYYTPFVRLEHGELRSKDMRDVRPEFNEGVNIVPQVIANSGEEMNVLVDYLKSLGYNRIDVNAGCPFPLQTRHGRGAGLLVAPDRFEELASVMMSLGGWARAARAFCRQSVVQLTTVHFLSSSSRVVWT